MERERFKDSDKMPLFVNLLILKQGSASVVDILALTMLAEISYVLY